MMDYDSNRAKKLIDKLRDIDVLIDYFNLEQLDDIEAILESIVNLITKEDVTPEERSAFHYEVLQHIDNIENKNCL